VFVFPLYKNLFEAPKQKTNILNFQQRAALANDQKFGMVVSLIVTLIKF
jgi:hypothetical protein